MNWGQLIMSSNREQKTVTEKPTLKTISRLSGLAVATVSRALNDAPDLRDDTKQMVRRIANEIGYVPNRAGLGLRTGRTNVISLILSTENDMMNHTGQLLSSIAGGLRGTPYHLTITPYFPDQDRMEPVRYVVETRSADAIILNETLDSDPRVTYLMEKGFPFATHGRTKQGLEHPYFDFDNDAFARIAVRKLARRGSKHIVLIAPPRDQAYSRHMCRGAIQEAEKLGITFEIEELTDAKQHSAQIQATVEKRLRENPRIDGYIGASALTTMATVAGLETLGRKLGEDIHLATKEPLGFMKLFRKEIFVQEEDVFAAGTFLAGAVLQAILNPDKPPMQQLDIPEDDGN